MIAALKDLRGCVGDLVEQRSAMAAHWYDTAKQFVDSREHYLRLAVEEEQQAERAAAWLRALEEAIARLETEGGES